MKLASILNPDLIFTGLKAESRDELYTEIIKRAAEVIEFSESPEQLCTRIVEREDIVGIPYEGMAIPHLRLPELNDLYVVVGILSDPTMLKDSDLKPTRIVVMSFISDNTTDVYLKALAAFTKYFMNPANIDKIDGSASAEEFIELLARDDVKLKKNITAEDVMKRDFASVKLDAPLSEAVDKFVTHKVEELPVVDDAGKLLGIISATKLVRDFMPDYIMMMDNLDFLNSFEPFEKIFQQEGHHMIKDHMRDPIIVVKPDTPLIQFTVKIIRGDAHGVVVVDNDKKVVGMISIKSIIHKVLRG